MPISIREQLLSAITTAVDGEYGVPAPEDERDLPLTLVRDEEETVTESKYGYEYVELPVIIATAQEAPARADGASIAEYMETLRAACHELLAGVRQAMLTDATFGGLADGVDYASGSIATEAGRFCFAEATFNVRYHTVRGDPYTID